MHSEAWLTYEGDLTIVAWSEQTLSVKVPMKVLVGSDRVFLSGSCVGKIVVVIWPWATYRPVDV